ncbi:MAG: hypothetical protein ACTSQE_17170, partial [Candidatus Heimdallarchaeaceae archaeon]
MEKFFYQRKFLFSNPDKWREKGRELLKIVEGIEKKFLFVVDEFPLMVKKMMDKDNQVAVNFLEWFRALRQGPNNL